MELQSACFDGSTLACTLRPLRGFQYLSANFVVAHYVVAVLPSPLSHKIPRAWYHKPQGPQRIRTAENRSVVGTEALDDSTQLVEGRPPMFKSQNMISYTERLQ